MSFLKSTKKFASAIERGVESARGREEFTLT
jgi:hypothetical protein